MSNSIFVMMLALLGLGLYFYINNKWKKRESALNEFAFEMQREFAKKTQSVSSGTDYFKKVQAFYEAQGFNVSKHPDFVSDFIAKKAKDIIFIRVQTPDNTQGISANSFQTFIGQTVLYAMDNPLYGAYNLHWHYVCSKMMCDQSARIFIKRYENKLKFELIEAV